jgi:hypothetical protein
MLFGDAHVTIHGLLHTALERCASQATIALGEFMILLRGRGRITGWIAAVVCSTCVQTRACHVQVHFTKAEVDAANIRLYDRDVSERDRDITGFDQKHGMLGEVLGSQQFYEQELLAWKSHPVRFEHEHPGLGRVIDGDMLFHAKHPFEPSITVVPSGLLQPGDSGGTVPKTPGQPGGGIVTSQSQISSVPEPASGVLGFTALVVGLLVAALRRQQSKVTPDLAAIRR